MCRNISSFVRQTDRQTGSECVGLYSINTQKNKLVTIFDLALGFRQSLSCSALSSVMIFVNVSLYFSVLRHAHFGADVWCAVCVY